MAQAYFPTYRDAKTVVLLEPRALNNNVSDTLAQPATSAADGSEATGQRRQPRPVTSAAQPRRRGLTRGEQRTVQKIRSLSTSHGRLSTAIGGSRVARPTTTMTGGIASKYSKRLQGGALLNIAPLPRLMTPGIISSSTPATESRLAFKQSLATSGNRRYDPTVRTKRRLQTHQSSRPTTAPSWMQPETENNSKAGSPLPSIERAVKRPRNVLSPPPSAAAAFFDSFAGGGGSNSSSAEEGDADAVPASHSPPGGGIKSGRESPTTHRKARAVWNASSPITRNIRDERVSPTLLRRPPTPDPAVPSLPTNVLSDQVPLEEVETFGTHMLYHLEKTKHECLSEERELREQLHEDVDKGRDRLPLTFLFERSAGAKGYVARRALDNVSRIIKRLLHELEAEALKRWVEFVEEMRAADLRASIEARQKEGGAGSVVRIFNQMVLRKAAAALKRWKRFNKACRREEHDAAAQKIQGIWRHYLGWWNFIKREKNKRKHEQKRTAHMDRLVLFEWLAKRRMVQVIAARRRDILENRSATIIQRNYLKFAVWKASQDDMKRRRAEACVRRMLFRRRNAAFNSWALYSAKMKRCKDMFSKAMMDTMRLRFLLWDAFTQASLKDKRDQGAASRCLRRLLNRRMAACFASWWAYTDQMLNLKRMMRRSLGNTLTSRFEMWADFAYETKMSRLSLHERLVREALKKMFNRQMAAVWRTFVENVQESRENKRRARGYLVRMLKRRMAESFFSWRNYTVCMNNVRRMCKRALGQDLRWRFERWSDWAVGELVQRNRENERKVRNAVARLLMKTIYNAFSALHTNAVQRIGVRRMLKRALAGKKTYCFDRWFDFALECRENNERAAKWFQRWWNAERQRAFTSWRLYAKNSIRVKKMAIRAVLGKRLRMLLAWHKFAIRCRCFKSQVAMKACIQRTGQIGLDGLRDFPDLQQDAFDLLKLPPGQVNEVEIMLLNKARKKMEAWYDLNELMALRVQCSWRCRAGRLSLHLAKIARAERIKAEEEEHRRLVKAARLVQAVYRGRLGKKTLAQLVLTRRKEQLKKEYLLERKAKEARERWEHDQKEMIYRAEVMREVEERKAREAAEWELEKERRGKAWIKVPVAELGEGQTVKDLEEGEYYWYNEVTEVTQWSRPEDYISGDPPPPPPTEEQILKAWRVVDDETTGTQYFYNDLTEENRWDPPEGFKVPPPKGKCSICREMDAVRHCKTCDDPFCIDCFISEHATPAKRAHMFRVLKKATPDPFQCGKCDEGLQATYSTPDYKSCFCDNCFAEWFDYDEGLQEMGFKHFKPGSLVCSQCTVRLAEFKCQQCDDNYCGDCTETLHRSGRKAQHVRTEILPFHKDELEDGEAYCVECEHTKAALMCEQCGDAYCDRCYRRTHARGRKSQHTTITWEEAQTPWEEFWDEDEGRTVYYNTKTRERTFEKPAALLWGKERMAWQEAHNSAVDDAREAAEQMAEMQRQMAEMQDKMAGMSKRRPGMIWGVLKKAAKAVAPSLAIDKEAREAAEKADEDFLDSYDHTKEGGSPGDAARARMLRKKKRKKDGLNRQKKSLLFKALGDPKTLLTNTRGMLKEHKNEQAGLDERYLRKMLIGRKDAANDKSLSSTQRKDAELAAYESQMSSYLAKARAEGREMEFKREVKAVKQMRKEEEDRIKEAKRKGSRFN